MTRRYVVTLHIETGQDEPPTEDVDAAMVEALSHVQPWHELNNGFAVMVAATEVEVENGDET